MKIFQHRYLFDESFTLSRLYVDHQFECYILEDRVRQPSSGTLPINKWKIPAETAIPVGTYNTVIDMSPRFKKLMIHLLDVPGFTGIRCHPGNSSHDTEGCLITGKERNEKLGEVSSSRLALAALFSKIQAALSKRDNVEWTVVGLIPPDVPLPYRDKSEPKFG